MTCASMIPVLDPQSFFVTIAAFGAIGEDDYSGGQACPLTSLLLVGQTGSQWLWVALWHQEFSE